MNTKLLMTVTSVVLGLAGLFLLFAPDTLLTALGLPLTAPLPLLTQLGGSAYLGFALMDWTAKESVIGGIYGRALTFGNFVHFAVGTLVLLRYLFSSAAPAVIAATVIYAIFAALFGYLVFRHSGLANPWPTGEL
jgi:hypothetical protein